MICNEAKFGYESYFTYNCYVVLLNYINRYNNIIVFLTVVVLIITCIPVLALDLVSAKEFLALKNKLSTKLPTDTLKQSPADYVGKYFEIRGTYSGFVSIGGNSGGSLSVTDLSGTSWNIICSDTPTFSPGSPVACLVQIQPGSSVSLSDLALKAWTHGGSLNQLELSTTPKPAPKVAASPKAQKSIQATKTYKQISSEEFVNIYKRTIKGFNPNLSEKDTDIIARSVLGFSDKYKLDPRLVCAVIFTESRFKLGATSRSGAQGLGQLMPATAAGMGITNSYDPVQNVYGSARYIRSMLERVSGKSDWRNMTWDDLSLALAAYNAGAGAVKKHGGIPPYKETQNYVKKVTEVYKTLCGIK